jgi:hypothetical protein
MAAIYSNGGNRWNILGFNFTKRDALSSVYKISMLGIHRVLLTVVVKHAIREPWSVATSIYGLRD